MTPLVVAAAVAAAPYYPQVVEVGTFDLGDLVFASPSADWMVKDLKAAGVDVDEVKTGMNRCKLHLFDYQVRRPDGRRVWCRGNGGGRPRVLVEGPLSVGVKDGKGNEVVIAADEVKVAPCHTDQGGGAEGKSATVDCLLHFTVRFDGLAVPDGEVVGFPKRGGFNLAPVSYDTTGRAKVVRE